MALRAPKKEESGFGVNLNIIFLGAPGSGKGTQAVMLSERLNIPAVSTGEAFRKEVALESEVGNLAKSYMNSGKLIPDELVLNVIKNRIIQQDCENGFILDGFPRNIFQAIELEKIITSLGRKIDVIFNFEISEDILIKRISGRFSCRKCGAVYNHYFKLPKQAKICDKCGSSSFESRDDDNEATVKNRLKVYHESTFELIGYYQKKGLLVSISAIKSAPLVFEELITSVKISKNNQ